MNAKIKSLIITSALTSALVPMNTIHAMDDDEEEKLNINDWNAMAATVDSWDDLTTEIDRAAVQPHKKQRLTSVWEAQEPMITEEETEACFNEAAAQESPTMTEEKIEALFNETSLGVEHSMTTTQTATFFNQCAQASTCDEKAIVVKQLLQKFSPNSIINNYEGTTLLVYAIENNHPEVAKILIELGADINKKNKITDTTPLVAAIRHNNNTIATLLIKRGAQVNSADMIGLTPLMEAITSENVEIIKTLIQHKADVNARNQYHITPLIYAARRDKNTAVTLLIMAGARAANVKIFNAFSDKIKKIIKTAQKTKEILEQQNWFPKDLVNTPVIPMDSTDIRRLIVEYTDLHNNPHVLDTFLNGNAPLHNLIAEYAANEQFSNEVAVHQGVIQEIKRRQEKE